MCKLLIYSLVNNNIEVKGALRLQSEEGGREEKMKFPQNISHIGLDNKCKKSTFAIALRKSVTNKEMLQFI